MKPGNILKVIVLSLVVVTGVFAIETFEEYQTAMRGAGGGNGMIRKSNGDMAMATKGAALVKENFAQMKAYWEAKGANDAVEFSDQAIQGADAVAKAAAAGDAEGVAAGAKMIGATCSGCHEAHRGGSPGNFTIQ